MRAIRLFLSPPRNAALTVALAGAATILGALAFEYAGYPPCPLCLTQRIPYYVGVPLALLAALVGRRSSPAARVGLIALAVVFAAGSALGVYHAGAEWHFWAGPTECAAGASAPLPAQAGDLLKSLPAVRLPSCTEPALRIFKLSLAGWNAVISAGLALVAALGAVLPQGSSSLSQYR